MTDQAQTINPDKKIIPITVSYGDGNGPEIMEYILSVLQQAGARISINSVDMGENFYKREYYHGIPDSAWKTITHHPVIFMAPSTKPEGEEYHDLLHTLCKSLELHTTVAPLSHLSDCHILIGRNEAAFQQTLGYRLNANTVEELRIFTDKQTGNLLKHARNYAYLTGLKNIYTIAYSATSLSADRLKNLSHHFLHNISHQAFHGTLAQFLAQNKAPSVVISQESGLLNSLALMHDVERRGMGFLGEHYLLFTGAAPKASFEGQLHAAILMLTCLGQHDIASRLHHAWICTLENEPSLHEGSIADYASALLATIKEQQQTEIPVLYHRLPELTDEEFAPKTPKSQLIGVEISLGDVEDYNDCQTLSDTLTPLCEDLPLQLQLIASRGFVIWPKSEPYSFDHNDYITLRFLSNQSPKETSESEVNELLKKLEENNISVRALRQLYLYDEHLGFSVL